MRIGMKVVPEHYVHNDGHKIVSNSNTCFPAPTLARKLFGSNMSLSRFSIGASFGSTNCIHVTAFHTTRGTFAKKVA